MPKIVKKCKCCGLEFETNNPQKLYCNRDHYLPCPVCGKLVLKKDRDFSKPPGCCSKECASKKNKQNLPEKRCVICGELFKPKSGVATICDREHHSKCVICEKDFILTKQMFHDGVNTCSKECSREKLRRFYQSKYGVDHPMQNSNVQKHHQESMIKKYGVKHALESDQFLQAAYQTNLEKYGTKFACLRPECKDVSPVPVISKANKMYGHLIENLGLEVEYEKMVGGQSFDLCMEELKTLIEIDPTYTHNSFANHWNKPLSADYHSVKTDIASSAGYKCIHVFEWDSTEKILDLIRPKVKIGARNCKIKEISVHETNQFLNQYHLQGTLRKQTYRIGLYFQNELIQLMTFGNSRYDKTKDAELLRLCTKSGYIVIGGAERLFNRALQDNPEWKSIISYCDKAKFSGSIYYRLGMKLSRITPPQEVWSRGTEKVTAMLLRQRGFDQLFHTTFGKGTSNNELMIQHGWLPVYDCGQFVFEYRRSKE